MTNVSLDSPTSSPPSAIRRAERPDIPLAGGKVAKPRQRWAEGLGICDKTAAKVVDTVYISNVAYVIEPDATAKLIKHGQRRGRR